jgi:hypothetical protein
MMATNQKFSRKKLNSILATLFLISVVVACGVKQSQYTPNEWESVEYNGAIRISLTHPYSKKDEDYEILLASSMETKEMAVCVDNETPDCKKGGPGYYTAKVLYTDGSKMFFKTDYSALLEDGLVLNVLAFDAAGKQIDQRKIKFEKTP